MGEKNLVLLGSVWNMSLSVESISFGTEESNDKFVISDKFFEAIAVNSGGWWSGLLDNVVNNCVFGSSSFVVRWVSSPIKLQISFVDQI